MALVEQIKETNIQKLNGFDPLSEGAGHNENDRSVFEEATRRVVQNILKSYTGYFDIFSELIQNSLDAIDKKLKTSKENYSPQLWIKIDIANRTIRIVDNGTGMTFDEVRFCFRPNVSFKNRKESRGHKGVGATFLMLWITPQRLDIVLRHPRKRVVLARPELLALTAAALWR